MLAAASGPMQRIWFDPLTKKKFYSENTYLAFIRSKKYQDLVKKSGNPPPPAVVTVRRQNEPEQPTRVAAPKNHVEKNEEVDSAVDSGSEWETVSEEEMEGSEVMEEWDINRSLFDNYVSSSMEANLEYMWQKFGFYLPDAEYLADPEGMLRYLGAKLQYGHIPLYESGNNPNAKSFGSLHAVQRHMVDSGKCKVLYEGNEDEYDDFYADDDGEDGDEEEMGSTEREEGTSRALILDDRPVLENAAVTGYELAVPSASGGTKVLGAREFARYYKQRHRTGDLRDSAAAARVLAQYRRLEVPLIGDGSEAQGQTKQQRSRAERAVQRHHRGRLMVSMRRNVNDNLPKNVPY